MTIMSPRGWATFAWQSDYGQFYLVDFEDAMFVAPENITPEMMERCLFMPAAGLVIYTESSLYQEIRIAIYDAEPAHDPVEPIRGNPWTKVETATAYFPSRKLTIASPSRPDPMPAGPVFLLSTETMAARICWMEFQGVRDESVPVEPNVIDIKLWPQTDG